MSISKYILDAREQYRLEVRERNTWLTRLRWYYLVILAIVAVVTSFLTNVDARRSQEIAVAALSVGLIINFILWAATKPKKQSLQYYQAIAVIQLLLDVVLAAGIVYLQSGLASRATVLFAVPIVGAGLLFNRFIAYIAAL